MFFDRDGVIFRPGPENSPEKILLGMSKTRAPFSFDEFRNAGGVFPHAKSALQEVKHKGFLAILVTNQPDIVYGNISREEWERIHAYATRLPFDDVFVCFHGRNEGCGCRKPKPGMLLEAARKWNIDLATSYFVGDTEADIGAAKAAGCKSILIDAWYNTMIESDFKVKYLHDVVNIVQ